MSIEKWEYLVVKYSHKINEREVMSMTKKDLRSGMVVEDRDGDRFLVIAETQDLIGKEYHMDYRTHEDDLTYCSCCLDIMKVYRPVRGTFDKMLDNPGKPIWERPTYYNGKVVCVECNNEFLTKGKIYEFKDGFAIDDEEDRFPLFTPVTSLGNLNSVMYSDFIEVVE